MQSPGFQCGEDESVSGRSGPVRLFDGGKIACFHWLPAPVFTSAGDQVEGLDRARHRSTFWPREPHFDPFRQDRNLFGRKFGFGGHLVDVTVINGGDEQAGCRLFQIDRRPGISPLQQSLTRIEP